MLNSPSEFGESAYIALKNNDSDGFRTLFLAPEDSTFIFESFNKDSTSIKEETGKEFESFIQDVKLEFRSYQQNIDFAVKQYLQGAREKGTRMGIDWDQLEFKGVDVSPERIKYGTKTVDLKVFFTSNSKDFILEFEKVIELGGSYKCGEPPLLNPYTP